MLIYFRLQTFRIPLFYLGVFLFCRGREKVRQANRRKVRSSKDSEEGPSPAERGADGVALEAAQFSFETLSNLSKIAHRHRLGTLGYLLDMAILEAEDLVRRFSAPQKRRATVPER